ncbi:MAG: hypothetical protein Q8R12_03900 [bacterium]|nr:hypothetical protein [bacterium]
MHYFREAVRRLWLPLLFFAFLWAIPVLANEVIQAPVYKEGDFWVYSVKEWDFITRNSNPLDGEYEFIYRGEKFEIFSREGDQKVPLAPGTREADILGALFGGVNKLKFPFSKDKLEDKTVGARNFRALKIENTVLSRGVALDIIRFYSQECKCFVYHLMDSSRRTGTGGKRSVELLNYGNASQDFSTKTP